MHTQSRLNTIIRNGGVEVKLENNSVIITVRGEENVARLFSAHPSEVTFGIAIPGEPAIAKTVKIDYRD